MAKAHVGKTVLFHTQDEALHAKSRGGHQGPFPALITKVNQATDDSAETVNLHVFMDGHDEHFAGVKHGYDAFSDDNHAWKDLETGEGEEEPAPVKPSGKAALLAKKKAEEDGAE